MLVKHNLTFLFREVTSSDTMVVSIKDSGRPCGQVPISIAGLLAEISRSLPILTKVCRYTHRQPVKKFALARARNDAIYGFTHFFLFTFRRYWHKNLQCSGHSNILRHGSWKARKARRVRKSLALWLWQLLLWSTVRFIDFPFSFFSEDFKKGNYHLGISLEESLKACEEKNEKHPITLIIEELEAAGEWKNPLGMGKEK